MSQVWHTNTAGGYMYSDNLSKKLRHAVQPMVKFRQFCDVKDAAHQGLSKGDTFHWNVYTDVATQGSTLLENEVMPETSFAITQGTMTITEAGNSVPYTSKLDNLSEQPVTEIINKVLKHDASKFFDTQASTQFAATQLWASPATSSTIDVEEDGAWDETGLPLQKAHILELVAAMRERNVPGYSGDDYYMIGLPSAFTTFRIELEAIHMYTSEGLGYIMNGEVGRYQGARFVEQTFLANDALGTGSTVYMIGEDTVAEAIAIPEEMRGKIPTDFGRSKGVAWYYLGGFGLIHDSANGYSAVANSRILKWGGTA